MGNADLRNISCISEIDYSRLSGQNVAVDAHNWLYKYITTISKFTNSNSYTRSDGEELPNLIGIPRGLKRFTKHNIKPVFVFDGTAHKLKNSEIESRKESKKWAKKKAEQSTSKIEKSKYESYAQRLTPEIIETSLHILSLFGVRYFTAPQNAEAQASKMAANGFVDYVISDDYDTILFGAPSTVRNFTSSKQLEQLSLNDTLEKHNITHQQLIHLSLLCGTDYNDGIHGIGSKTALKKIKEHGDLDTVLNKIDETIENKETLISIFSDPNVTTDYPYPSKIEPDIESIRSYLKQNNISIGEVETSLQSIKQDTQQTGISDWG